MTDHEQPSIPGFYRDPKLVTRFVADELDEEGRAELADQVAAVATYHAELPNALAVLMTRFVKHLGGETALVRWLDRFPGRPGGGRARRPVGKRDRNAAPDRHTHHDGGREPDRFPAPDRLPCSAE